MDGQQYIADSAEAEEFINDNEIRETMAFASSHKNDREMIGAIIDKAAELKGLDHREAAVLMECDDPDLVERIFALAKKIKKALYGNRIVMFAPWGTRDSQ